MEIALQASQVGSALGSQVAEMSMASAAGFGQRRTGAFASCFAPSRHAVETNRGDRSRGMRFEIEHSTRYSYDIPVNLGPHILRLVPQVRDADLQHHIELSPQATQRNLTWDEFGNRIMRVLFTGPTQQFSCVSRASLTTTMPPTVTDLGWSRLPWSGQILEQSVFRVAGEVAPDVARFAEQHARAVQGRPLAFLERLNRYLYERVDRQIRWAGQANAPSDTLTSMRGACRDITMLFMAACRAQGFISRFVSGYQASVDATDGQRHLHAWPEVYLPGFGWQGYDPTHGLLVRDGHVALCAGPTQAVTMPIEGGFTFSGTAVNSTLDYTVRIQAFSD
jgi:transglutaminase-like putative cysteine protease